MKRKITRIKTRNLAPLMINRIGSHVTIPSCNVVNGLVIDQRDLDTELMGGFNNPFCINFVCETCCQQF